MTSSARNIYGDMLFYFLLVGIGDFGTSIRLTRRDVHGLLGVSPRLPTNDPLPPDLWFTQILDHFDPTRNDTWFQRYQMVDNNYDGKGTVFLMIGGEGEANAGWMVTGAWLKYATLYNALLFQLEHRYYGKSQPTSDLSVENLKYLSSEQALADLAHFITSMNLIHKLPVDTKWIVFGGSYPGNLAAWMRYKYPHLVHAAMSASGPVLAKVDFYEYMDVVSDSLATHSEQCVEAVRDADRQLNLLIRHPIGVQTINKDFRLCAPLDNTNKNDVANLLESLAGNIAGVVQYNNDNRVHQIGVNIDTICDIMVNESAGTPVVRYAIVNSVLMDKYGENCLDYEYDKYVQRLRDTRYVDNERQWMYQTCTEFGYYQTAENSKKLFGNDFPIDYQVQLCSDIFGKEFTLNFVATSVQRTNEMYGGLRNTATRVVYVHGTIDPWHVLGITTTRIPESPAILINGTAHCANMYTPADTDLPQLKATRKRISSLIGQWLQQS